MGIALAMLLFRDKYAKEEQDLGLGAFFMGLSFITEGALPLSLRTLSESFSILYAWIRAGRVAVDAVWLHAAGVAWRSLCFPGDGGSRSSISLRSLRAPQ